MAKGISKRSYRISSRRRKLIESDIIFVSKRKYKSVKKQKENIRKLKKEFGFIK